MRNLLFVHGTGVREASYKLTFGLVGDAMRDDLPHVTPHECYWGDLGATLRQNGDSIPTYSTARAVGGTDPEQESLALWRLLYEDPFYELRYLATQPQAVTDLPPNIDPQSVVLAEKLRELNMPALLTDLVARYRLLDLWNNAYATVRDEPATAIAIDRNQDDSTESRAAVARAIVASLLSAAGADQRTLPGSDDRNRMVNLLVQEFGGKTRSVVSWLGGQLTGLAESVSSYWIKRKRGKVSDAGLPALGDIILYQTRGSAIRERIKQRILEVATQPDGTTDPIIVVAHSLGGIACVDLLASEKLPVSHLITCGSQAPLLYEIDALVSRRFGQPLPVAPDFPAWLNIYDENDFLSYVGSKVFPGRVQDVRVESKQPFPESHSAYWGNHKVWTAIAEFLR